MGNYIPGPVRDMHRMNEEIKTLLDEKSDQERSAVPYMHEMWNPNGAYTPGIVVRRGEELYKCLMAHVAQPAWTPEDSPSLWARIMYREGIRIIEYPIPAVDPFNIGDLGWWGDTLYRSLINANVHTPEQYPTGWEAVE